MTINPSSATPSETFALFSDDLRKNNFNNTVEAILKKNYAQHDAHVSHTNDFSSTSAPNEKTSQSLHVIGSVHCGTEVIESSQSQSRFGSVQYYCEKPKSEKANSNFSQLDERKFLNSMKIPSGKVVHAIIPTCQFN